LELVGVELEGLVPCQSNALISTSCNNT